MQNQTGIAWSCRMDFSDPDQPENLSSLSNFPVLYWHAQTAVIHLQLRANVFLPILNSAALSTIFRNNVALLKILKYPGTTTSLHCMKHLAKQRMLIMLRTLSP